jgi:hypothetical protein
MTRGPGKIIAPLNYEFNVMNDNQNLVDQDQADVAILNFDVDDVAIEIAATGVGTIPTASVNMVPPNCCVQRPMQQPAAVQASLFPSTCDQHHPMSDVKWMNGLITDKPLGRI